jgi:eukaryotic-like serine/threonine-protein kinase
MGVVWQARHLQTRQQVALKVIHPGIDSRQGEIERFLTEAQAGTRLQHPQIVRVFHFDTFDGQPYFTMELLPWGTLQERLARGPLTPRNAAFIVRQAAAAIHYAHEQRVLHRDLKPSNLLLAAPAGRVDPGAITTGQGPIRELEPSADAVGGIKVGDFGLARLQDATHFQTGTGDRFGTPSYMAPEQAGGRRQDARTDVYGLGAVLYACLTGRPPFQAATAVETLLQVQQDEP